MLQDLECHKGAVLSCDVSSDRHLFATTSADRTAKVRRGTDSYIRSVSADKILFTLNSELRPPLCLDPGL